jgi:signal transduction histidine kinase
LIGFMIGLLLLVSIIDYQNSLNGASLVDFLREFSDLGLLCVLIIAIPTISGTIIGTARSKIIELKNQVDELAARKEKLTKLQALTQTKSEELQELLDQESGYFVDNWDQLVTEKDKLREEAEISSMLVRVALEIGNLAGPKEVLTVLRSALTAVLFADDCLTFGWDNEAKAFVCSDETEFKIKSRSVKAVRLLQKTMEPISIEDIDDCDLFPARLQSKLGAKSAMLIPCVTRDKVTAIAIVLYKAGHKFTARDTQLAAGIVSQARIVFENAYLYEDVVFSRNELQRLLTRLASTQEDERRRISRDLHDGVIQNLSGIIFSLSFLGNALEEGQNDAKEELGQLEGIVNETITDLRKVIYDLRPTILDSLGLTPTLEKHLERFGQANGIEIDYNPRLKVRLADVVETGLFRLAQEALNNIKKHAKANKVTVDICRKKDTIVMTIKDDGQGFDMNEIKERASQDSGFGLSGMNERVQSMRGSVKISSKPGEGTQVSVIVPYEIKGE